jgi:methyl-galactoside transport system substrate-binding protein
MKKVLVALMVLVLAVGSVFAQGGTEAATGTIKMAGIIRNQNEQFVKNYTENLKKVAAANGVDLVIMDGEGQVDKQLDQLSTLISQGYKYFVIIIQDGSASEQMAQMIKEVGGAAAFSNIQPSVEALKVSTKMYYASSPEAVAGQYQARILDEYFTKYPEKAPGKVLNMLYLEGQLGHPAQINREAGLIDELKKFGYTVNFVAKDTANWTPDQAQQKMDAWLAAFGGKFNCVVAQNDDMALGAIESLKAAKYTKADASDGTKLTVPVIGVDATPTGLASMKADEMYATVLQDAIGQSETAFYAVLEAAKTGTAVGKTINGLAAPAAPIDEAPANDAAVIAQCFLVPFKPVTKANMAEFL